MSINKPPLSGNLYTVVTEWRASFGHTPTEPTYDPTQKSKFPTIGELQERQGLLLEKISENRNKIYNLEKDANTFSIGVIWCSILTCCMPDIVTECICLLGAVYSLIAAQMQYRRAAELKKVTRHDATDIVSIGKQIRAASQNEPHS